MSLVGRLEDLGLSDIFQILSVGKKTGSLVLHGSRGNALIVFKNGMVVRAETSDMERTLGEDLVKAGVIKDTIFFLASEVRKELPSKSVSEILFDLGSVTKETLEKITRKRMERVICQLLLWNEGNFRFELDDVEPHEKADLPDVGWELSKGMSPEYLLMEGARVHDELTQTISVSSEGQEVSFDEKEDWEDDWDMQPQAERKDITSLKALTQELRFPNSASEITLLIMRFASDLFQHGVLFMVGDNEIVGLGQFGMNAEGSDERIRQIKLDYTESEFLKGIIEEKRPHKAAIAKDVVTEVLVREIGVGWPDEASFFPIVAEGRVVALLYCDNLLSGESSAETAGLEIFIDQAGLALEKALLQRKIQDMERKN